jgi:TolB-like protein
VKLRRWFAPAVLVAAAIVALAVVALLERAAAPPAALSTTLERALTRTPGAPALGVAVLPLTAPPGDPELASLGDALCEAIVQRVNRSTRLTAVSCTSSRIVAQMRLDDEQAAHLLDVQSVLAGTIVRVSGDAFRIAVEMRRARRGAGGGEILWQLDGEFDAARLQELPAQIVARLTGAVQPAVRRVDPRAYRLILQAISAARRLGVADAREARRLIEEALAIEPGNLLAQVVRVFVFTTLHQLTGEVGAAEVAQLRAETGARVLQADPGNAYGLMMVAETAAAGGEWIKAFELVERALAARPTDAVPLRYFANVLLAAGYVQRGRDVARQAARLDPLSANSHRILAVANGLLGDDQGMRDSAEIARDLGMDAHGYYLGFVALRQGDFAAAEKSLRDAVQSVGALSEWIAPTLRAIADPRHRAYALRTLDAQPAATRAVMNEFFLYYALVGDAERSLRALLRQAEKPPGPWAAHVWAPELAAVRALPQFQEYLTRSKLPVLWDAHGAPDVCRGGADGRYACR